MSNLFTAVSVEQQEIVAGGNPKALFVTLFAGEKIRQAGGSNSDWNGSSAGGYQNITRVITGGLTFLKA